VRLRLLERVGSAIGFSPEGREVRVWVEGMPGADETEVVPGLIESVRDDGAAVIALEPAPADAPDLGGTRRVLAVPHEPGWGLQALWFSFIAVNVFELDGEGADAAAEPASAAPPSAAPAREPLGRWFIRLGAPA
jgi:hypothetical protein